jgi:hypothetical protein
MLATAERNVQRARQFNSSKQPRAIAAAANESSFGEKLKKAVAARRGTPSATTRKEADEQAQKERSRYRKQRRERSKGE